MEEHSGVSCHSVLSPAAIYITNCHLKPELRFIPYIFICVRACFHIICHNSKCPAGLCTTVALHRPPLLTSLSTGRFSLLNKDALVCSAVAYNNNFILWFNSHNSVKQDMLREFPLQAGPSCHTFRTNLAAFEALVIRKGYLICAVTDKRQRSTVQA